MCVPIGSLAVKGDIDSQRSWIYLLDLSHDCTNQIMQLYTDTHLRVR